MNRPRKKLRSDKTETVVIIKGKGSKQNFNIMIDFEQKKSCELQTLPASKIIVNENTKYFYIIFLSLFKFPIEKDITGIPLDLRT